MENILEFLENNYIWFLVAAVVLLFALIGFIVDSKRKQKKMEGNLESVPSTPVESQMATATEQNNVNFTAPTEVAPEMPFEVNTSNVESAPEPVNVPNPEVNTFNSTGFSEPAQPEVMSFGPAPASQDMTFNDIPMPEVNSVPAAQPEVREEIIEPFNVGNPVVMEPSFAPAEETPAVQIEPVTPQVVNEPATSEPVVNLDQNFTVQEPAVVQNEESIVNLGE